MTSELASDHPLYNEELFPTLFNQGVEFHLAFEQKMGPMPSRWIYFRHGDLYVMGRPIWSFDSPLLKEFLAKQEASVDPSLVPFKDWGPPTAEQIKRFGYHVPEGRLVALGDNHPQSGDTRDFGPVPLENLLGSPSLLFWPPSEGKDWRLGTLPQPERSWFTLPNMIVNGVGLAAIFGYEFWVWRRRRQEDEELLSGND
jgi:signal peptidase I